jgi:hypothetical protein
VLEGLRKPLSSTADEKGGNSRKINGQSCARVCKRGSQCAVWDRQELGNDGAASRLEKDVAKEGEQEIALSVAAARIFVFPRSSKVLRLVPRPPQTNASHHQS